MPKKRYIQVENKNAIVELLEEGRSFERIFIATNAFKDPKTKKVMELARKTDTPIERVARRAISRRSKSSSKESVIGLLLIENITSIEELLNGIYKKEDDPFILIFNDIQYPHNLGAIFRTAFAAGVNGVIAPVQKGNLLNDEVVRISMGTCLRIPIIEMNLFAAIKTLKKFAVEVVGVDMEGELMYDSDLTGPKALMMGSEYMGLTSKMQERADKIISIPMREGLGSLNVSVASGLVMYEKMRQDLNV